MSTDSSAGIWETREQCLQNYQINLTHILSATRFKYTSCYSHNHHCYCSSLHTITLPHSQLSPPSFSHSHHHITLPHSQPSPSLSHMHTISHTPNHHHHHSPTLTTITILPHSPPSLSHTHNHHHHSPTYTNIISLSNTLNSTHSLPSLTLTTITITLSHSLPSLPHSQPLPLLSHALNHHSPPLTTITTTLR